MSKEAHLTNRLLKDRELMAARGEVKGRWEWRRLGRDGDKEKEMYPESGHNQTKRVTRIHGVKEVCMSEKENRASLFCCSP